MANDFEYTLNKGLNSYFSEKGIRALAYRQYKQTFTPQKIDILVDSPNLNYYLGIECKSVKDTTSGQSFYFKTFSTHKGVPQLESEHYFLFNSGRNGLIALEVRTFDGRNTKAYILPFEYVFNKYKLNYPGINFNELKSFPEILKKHGQYIITDDLMFKIWEFKLNYQIKTAEIPVADIKLIRKKSVSKSYNMDLKIHKGRIKVQEWDPNAK